MKNLKTFEQLNEYAGQAEFPGYLPSNKDFQKLVGFDGNPIKIGDTVEVMVGRGRGDSWKRFGTLMEVRPPSHKNDESRIKLKLEEPTPTEKQNLGFYIDWKPGAIREFKVGFGKGGYFTEGGGGWILTYIIKKDKDEYERTYRDKTSSKIRKELEAKE